MQLKYKLSENICWIIIIIIIIGKEVINIKIIICVFNFFLKVILL